MLPGLISTVAIWTPCLALFLLALVLYPPKTLLQWWALRHIPGDSGWLFIGHLLDVPKYTMPGFVRRQRKKHGPIFKVFMGRRLVVVLTNPDHIRSAAFRCTNHMPFLGAFIPPGVHKTLVDKGLVSAMDQEWRTFRAAWQPAFSPGSLAGYMPLMEASAKRLAEILLRKASPPPKEGGRNGAGAGGNSEWFDLHYELGRMTLQVVGSCAYGVNFGTLDDDENEAEKLGEAHHHDRMIQKGNEQKGNAGGPPLSPSSCASSAAAGALLARSCRDMFATMTMSQGSKWARINILLPEFYPLFSRLAGVFPDAPYTRGLKAREVLVKVSSDLLSNWKKGKGQVGQAVAGQAGGAGPGRASLQKSPSGGGGDPSQQPPSPSLPPWASASPPSYGAPSLRSVVDGMQAGGRSGGSSTTTATVAPGSFLAGLLAARDKGTGEQLTDIQILAQATTFILAGYETTSNALAFAIYLISQHPRVEAKLLEEIDRHFRGRGEGGDAIVEGDATKSPALDLGSYPSCRLLSEESVSKFVNAAAIFQEAIRLYPPAHITSRVVNQEGGGGGGGGGGKAGAGGHKGSGGGGGGLVVGGFKLPPGTNILLSIHEVHHDPRWWGEDPEQFLPERFLLPPAAASGARGTTTAAGQGPFPAATMASLSSMATKGVASPPPFSAPEGSGPSLPSSGPSTHIPFGLGTRMCPGLKFAQMEAMTALVHLYSRMTFELQPGQEGGALPIFYGLTTTPKEGVWVRAKPRQAAAATSGRA